jgi:hypothetical protein
MISLMSDDASPPDDVLSGLPRTRPQHRSAKRIAARTKTAAAKSAAKPKPVVAAAPKPSTPRPAYNPPKRADGQGPSGAELAATAVQAAGELVELGGRVLRDVLRRLPKP